MTTDLVDEWADVMMAALRASDGGNNPFYSDDPDAVALARELAEAVVTRTVDLAAGIKAAIIVRLISGETNQTYTATEVSTMVHAVVDEQVARLGELKP